MATQEIDALVERARGFLDVIEAEVHRLERQIFALRAGDRVLSFLLLGLVSLDQQATEYESLVLQLERFVGETFNRIEANALAGDLGAAQRLLTATQRIAGAAETADPINDLADNVKTLVKDTTRDLEKTGSGLATAVAVAAGAYVVVELLKLRGR